MVNNLRTFRLFLIGGAGAAAVSACAPTYQTSNYDASMEAGYGYTQSAYGYDSSQTAHSSRYGGELRGSCEFEVQSCGMMAVVPVYPVYQYVTPPAPEVQVVETPQVYEPETIPYVEPEPVPYIEPVYEPPVHNWPEPATTVTDWKPLRK